MRWHARISRELGYQPGRSDQAFVGVTATAFSVSETSPARHIPSLLRGSAWLLGRRLIGAQGDVLAGRALAQTGASYAAEWARCFAPRIRAAAVFAHLAIRPAFGALLRPIVKGFPGLLTFGAQLSGKTTQLVSPP